MRGRGRGSVGRNTEKVGQLLPAAGGTGRNGKGREAGDGGGLSLAGGCRLSRPDSRLLQTIWSRPFAGTPSIYNAIALPLGTRLYFGKYTDTFKEFRRGRGERGGGGEEGREGRWKLKVKHNLKLCLHHSFYNQLVTCLALNTVYVHN